MTIVLMLFVFLFGLLFYLVWALQQKLEKLANQLKNVTSKVNAGENVISENFATLEKRFLKLEHEIKEFRNKTSQRRKEVFQAAKVVQRVTNE